METYPIASLLTGSVSAIESAVKVLAGRRIVVLTGAGVSTDSGIPDYRGDGAPRRTPMSIQEFVKNEERRKRYWAGSHLGWRQFTDAVPNQGHVALSVMEEAGIIAGILTQNVDDLHRRAGSQRVIELHGAMNTVGCLACGQLFSREDIAARLTESNPWLNLPDDAVLLPDGDVDPGRMVDFTVPNCTNCGGMLKPDVVFFGELIPKPRFDAASAVVRDADALLIAGSSLAVNSGIRVLDLAIRMGHPIVIVNRGPTKGDNRATVRLEAGTTEALSALAGRLTGT